VSSVSTLRVPKLGFLVFTLSALLFLPDVVFAQVENPSSDGRPQSSQTSDSVRQPLDEPQGTPQDSSHGPATCGIKHFGQCLKDVGHDQAGIWTSPLRVSSDDAIWLVPFAGATGVALHYDAQAQQDLGIDKTRIDASDTFSNAGLYGSLAGDAGLYFLGVATHNDHLTETGRLGAEAVADASIVVEGLKLATNRQRPNEGNGQGDFWPHGTSSYEWDGSFPSEHAAATFALARVIASEYPSKRIQLAAYAFALAISASRVTAREHFPSDVLVGGTLGYLIGGYVIRHHASGGPPSSLFITPLVEQSTRTYGLRVEFTPGRVNLTKAERFIGRLDGTR